MDYLNKIKNECLHLNNEERKMAVDLPQMQAEIQKFLDDKFKSEIQSFIGNMSVMQKGF